MLRGLERNIYQLSNWLKKSFLSCFYFTYFSLESKRFFHFFLKRELLIFFRFCSISEIKISLSGSSEISNAFYITKFPNLLFKSFLKVFGCEISNINFFLYL